MSFCLVRCWKGNQIPFQWVPNKSGSASFELGSVTWVSGRNYKIVASDSAESFWSFLFVGDFLLLAYDVTHTHTYIYSHVGTAFLTGFHNLPVLFENRNMQVRCYLQVWSPASWRGRGKSNITWNRRGCSEWGWIHPVTTTMTFHIELLAFVSNSLSFYVILLILLYLMYLCDPVSNSVCLCTLGWSDPLKVLMVFDQKELCLCEGIVFA